MRCPYCDEASTRVVDSRPMADGIRRRRECAACGRRFTTHERPAPLDIRVSKARGRASEPFDAGKIARAVERVLRAGPAAGGATGDPADLARGLARRIEAELVDRGASTVSSGELAELVLARLRDLDRLAALRFAADYTDLEGSVAFPEPEPGAAEEGGPEAEQIDLFG